MTAANGQPRTCARCGADLDDSDEGSLCAVCAISAAEDVVSSRRQGAALQAAEKRPERTRPHVPVWLLVIVCVACAAFVLWRFPALVEATAVQPPVRTGAMTSGGEADACVANLWLYSQAMGFGREMPALTCPESGEPYVVSGSAADGTLEVTCPNPEVHALSSLRVTWSHRVPEAQR